MSIPCSLFRAKLEDNIADQPLDLSLNTLEKIVIQQFKNQISVQRISKNLNLSINKIYSIVNKTFSIKIKNFGKYTSDIKYRVKEARNIGKTLKEIKEIFKLKLYQVIYIDRCNRHVLMKQLYHSINPIPNRGYPPTTIRTLA